MTDGRPTAVEAAEPLALDLLDDFAASTGLTSDRAPRRYLWTDAFGVCGFLGAYERTGEERWLRLAFRLVDQVHHTLGRHREDDPREGWLSGLEEDEGAEHPTSAGLRIGKPEPERPRGEPYHPEREWDRDGQYYHYLTRWMHALNRMWRVTGEERFHRWAVELAGAANRGFIDGPRMFWKMSVDLARPLVPSMGQHDPLDGRVVVETLRATAPGDQPADALLRREALELDELCRDASWITHDALGVGGLLTDCLRLAQLRDLDRPLPRELEDQVYGDAARGLGFYAYTHRSDAPTAQRLAFRELGLAIGLHAAERVPHAAPAGAATPAVESWLRTIERHVGLAREIEELWARGPSREERSWTEHEDINTVMLAVALAPDGYLSL